MIVPESVAKKLRAAADSSGLVPLERALTLLRTTPENQITVPPESIHVLYVHEDGDRDLVHGGCMSGCDISQRIGQYDGLPPGHYWIQRLGKVSNVNTSIGGLKLQDGTLRKCGCSVVGGWNNHGYWVGSHKEPPIGPWTPPKARCGGAPLCKGCTSSVAHGREWGPDQWKLWQKELSEAGERSQ